MRRAVLIAALAMTACTTAPPVFPTEVTRFRADEVPRGTISLAPEDGLPDGPLFQSYAAAVGDALTAQGYTVVPPGASSAYVARIGFQSNTRSVRGPAPFTLGLGVGGGSYSRGGGVDVGVGGGIPIGKRELRDDTAATLSVRINRRAGDLGIWEGKAQTRLIRRAGAGEANAMPAKLAHALFTGFPGESGRTITVK
ncbi:DUF4136 domain-containing protein [Sphingomonas panacisoli]|uniref:DUF4136 domain-containing protein n=1 Tax=Sphingomonas panacisoli TaxID=1813879 RepID=A0A5B8LLL6_9SPHN|nr:DUF4136 domain-containing protein [Sphingomonas panacisoli]QDZ08422.1 DUF4136 domain-containing protein [Sphingomonas panacisoli]